MKKIIIFGLAWLLLGMAHSAQADLLLFYNAASGDGATARLDGAGNYQFVSSIRDSHAEWIYIAGASNGSMLFYNASTGNGATAWLDSAGNYQFVSAIPGFAWAGRTSSPPTAVAFCFTMRQPGRARPLGSTAPGIISS